MSPLLALLALHATAALGAEALVYAPEGELVVGDRAELRLLFSDDVGARVGEPADEVPTIVLSAGELLAPASAHPDGGYVFAIIAPDQAGPLAITARVRDTVVGASVPVGPPPSAALDVAATGWVLAGSKRPVEVLISGELGSASSPGLRAENVTVVVAEGEVAGLSAGQDVLLAQWLPGQDPFPRAVPLAVLDRRRPHDAPAWTVVQVRARPALPIRTEAGTRASVKVGARTYGPIVAGADGLATVPIEVRPGESTAEILLVDEVGNTRRSTLALGGDPRPSLLALTLGTWVAGTTPPAVHLLAVAPNGRPWEGDPPTCSTSLGDRARVVAVDPGEWRVTLPSHPADAFYDIRLDCQLDSRAASSVRIPVLPPGPSRLALRAYPLELSAETPRAQLQAFLENRMGDRLAAKNIQITAELGSVTVDRDAGGDASVVAEYRGEAAVAAGQDAVLATWEPDPSAGPVARLALVGRWPQEGGHVVVHARALDQVGLPVPGVPIQLQAGGAPVQVVADARGWAKSSVPTGASTTWALVEARSGGATARLALEPGALPSVDPEAADLSARLELPILSGTVGSVFLTTDPLVLVRGSGETARVRLLLQDRQGNPVTDDTVRLEASAGELGPLRRQGDGSLEATYRPPGDMPYGTVRITASSASRAFADASTELELLSREVRLAPGLVGGWLVGQRGLGSPYLGVEGLVRLPWSERGLYALVGLAYYGEQSTFEDVDTESEVQLSMVLLPLITGVVARRERQRVGTWIGGGMVVAPYRLDARFGDAVGARGVGLAPPGAEILTGVGWRVRNSELQLQAGYLLLTMAAEDVGWQGSVGGGLVTVGYKILY